MKMRKVFCDHCGKEIPLYHEVEHYDQQMRRKHELCWECMNELKSIIEKMEQAKKNRITAFLNVHSGKGEQDV